MFPLEERANGTILHEIDCNPDDVVVGKTESLLDLCSSTGCDVHLVTRVRLSNSNGRQIRWDAVGPAKLHAADVPNADIEAEPILTHELAKERRPQLRLLQKMAQAVAVTNDCAVQLARSIFHIKYRYDHGI
jgi:hypothetical protein